MIQLRHYKRFSRLIENETFEPMIFWGIRMAFSAMVPLIWGLVTNHIIQAVWVTLTAESLCWIELKGSYGWRLRVLTGGALLAIIFSVLGTVTGANIWLSVLGMLITGFLAGLFKNLGDRGSGLATGIYLLFILCNAYPVTTLPGLNERIILIIIGAGWAMLAGVVVSLFMPAEQPYRRYIGIIWRAIAGLVAIISQGWDGGDIRSNIRDIYLKEKEVRVALDNSFQLYTSMANQVSKEDNKSHFHLAQMRKAAALVAVMVTGISSEMEGMNLNEIDLSLRLKLSTLLSALQQTTDRIGVYTVTLKPEEAILITSRLSRLKKLIQLITDYQQENNLSDKAITRIIQLTRRSIRLMENTMDYVQEMGKDVPVYRSYSLIKTIFILHPRYIFNNLPLLFNFNTLTTRYALRAAIAASLGLFIYKWFHINHGYWLPFSVMIVLQPYFGATFKKAIDRIAGTLLGGLTGSLLLRFPQGYHIKEAMLFVTFVLMVYYLRKRYAVAAFVITLNVVLLFNLEATLNPMVIVTRALCTIGGAGLAVLAGFVLLPTWDKKWLPRHLAGAIICNYNYFAATFFINRINTNWTKNKRSAESTNSNLFDSFNRFMQEPGNKESSDIYYEMIMHSVRITRELNNINIEIDDKPQVQVQPATTQQQVKINKCLEWFNKVMGELTLIDADLQVKLLFVSDGFCSPFCLTETQMIDMEKLIIELQTLHRDLVKFTEKSRFTPQIVA